MTYRVNDGTTRAQQSAIQFASIKALSVHTKTKTAAGKVFLEVSVGNLASESALLLDAVRLDAPKGVTAKALTLMPPTSTIKSLNAAEYLQGHLEDLELLRPGSAQNYLFEVQGQPVADGAKADLGRLDLTWRRSLGQTGRLQTQHIAAAVFGRDPVSLQLNGIPVGGLALESPEALRLTILNHTQRQFGPLYLTLLHNSQTQSDQAFVIVGPQRVILGDVAALGSLSAELSILPLAVGLQVLQGLSLLDEAGQVVATLHDMPICVRAS